MPRSKKFRRALQILCCAGARSKNQNGFSKIHFQISGIPQGLDLRTWCPELKRPVSEWKIIKIALKSRVLLWKSQPWDCALNLRPQFQKGSPPHLWVEFFWINMRKRIFNSLKNGAPGILQKSTPKNGFSRTAMMMHARALSTRREIFTDQAETLHSVSTFKNLSNATLEKSLAAHGADNE